jgi:hypothetical protein
MSRRSQNFTAIDPWTSVQPNQITKTQGTNYCQNLDYIKQRCSEGTVGFLGV